MTKPNIYRPLFVVFSLIIAAIALPDNVLAKGSKPARGVCIGTRKIWVTDKSLSISGWQNNLIKCNQNLSRYYWEPIHCNVNKIKTVKAYRPKFKYHQKRSETKYLVKNYNQSLKYVKPIHINPIDPRLTQKICAKPSNCLNLRPNLINKNTNFNVNDANPKLIENNIANLNGKLLPAKKNYTSANLLIPSLIAKSTQASLAVPTVQGQIVKPDNTISVYEPYTASKSLKSSFCYKAKAYGRLK